MDFGAIPYATVVGVSFNFIKRLILAWKKKRMTKTLIIPNEEIKSILVKFLVQNSDFIVVDLDNVMSYLEFDEKDDLTKFQNSKVLYRRLIKKFLQYVVNSYGDEKIMYITKGAENIDLFNNCYAFIPSSIYESLKGLQHDEVFALRTSGCKKLMFSNENDVLEYVQKWV